MIRLLLIVSLFLSISASAQKNPCKGTDTIKGILYHAVGQSGAVAEIGYYIVPCGLLYTIGGVPREVSRDRYVTYPTFIPGTIRYWDKTVYPTKTVDNGFSDRYTMGWFTTSDFKIVRKEAVYGLLVISAKKQ